MRMRIWEKKRVFLFFHTYARCAFYFAVVEAPVPVASQFSYSCNLIEEGTTSTKLTRSCNFWLLRAFCTLFICFVNVIFSQENAFFSTEKTLEFLQTSRQQLNLRPSVKNAKSEFEFIVLIIKKSLSQLLFTWLELA